MTRDIGITVPPRFAAQRVHARRHRGASRGCA